MRVRTTELIGVSKEAYFHLKDIGRVQRGCKPLTDTQKEKLWLRAYKKDGLKVISDDSLGGGDGTYNGKWWSWNVQTIREMLTEAGYDWKELGTTEVIDI